MVIKLKLTTLTLILSFGCTASLDFKKPLILHTFWFKIITTLWIEHNSPNFLVSRWQTAMHTTASVATFRDTVSFYHQHKPVTGIYAIHMHCTVFCPVTEMDNYQNFLDCITTKKSSHEIHFWSTNGGQGTLFFSFSPKRHSWCWNQQCLFQKVIKICLRNHIICVPQFVICPPLLFSTSLAHLPKTTSDDEQAESAVFVYPFHKLQTV